MSPGRKIALTIYIAGIIIWFLVLVILNNMNHVITIKMNVESIDGAENYTILGDKAVIEYNGDIYTVDLVKHVYTLAPVIGIIIIIAILWIIIGIIVILTWED